MTNTTHNKTTPLIVLAGGLGTRLRDINPDRPKPMIEVEDKPFLEWLVQHYRSLSFRHFIFSTGYRAEVIENYPWARIFTDCQFNFVREASPLGTGGALIKIFNLLSELDQAWVANGDTLLNLNQQQFSELQSATNRFDNLYTALPEELIFDATPNLHTKDEFVLQVGPGGLHFDGGLVFVRRNALDLSLNPPCSLHDILGKSMSSRKTGFMTVAATCYDIGTPDRFERFKNEYLKGLQQ